MKLKTGENIRNYRKRNGLTQQEFADRLGVSYQSVSRWENSITYPDLEFIPSIAELLAVTVDELFGLTQTEMEKRAAETFDELRRECVKRDLDTERIVTLLKDIRLNYLCSNSAWRPWVEGNQRAFSDPKILPEVRLLAEAYLKRYPLSVEVIEAMAEVEDEEHINNFIDNYSTPFDCSKRKLLFNRYLTRGDSERIEPERTYQLFAAFDKLL
ncbi:MAG: helix-turn-helix transcriptional regulator, partial [Clostridia bacterium]|nr:helix-turn-helix transcriptional regulator [Clostridia bacterium]